MPTVNHIVIAHDRVRYRLRVEKLPSDESFDYFRVSGRNRSVVYKNNGPVLRRHALKHRSVTWKIHEGNIWNADFERKLLVAIEALKL